MHEVRRLHHEAALEVLDRRGAARPHFGLDGQLDQADELAGKFIVGCALGIAGGLSEWGTATHAATTHSAAATHSAATTHPTAATHSASTAHPTAAAHARHALRERGVDVEVGCVVEDWRFVQDVAHGIQLELEVAGTREVGLCADLEERRLELPCAGHVSAHLRHHLLEDSQRRCAVELERDGGFGVHALREAVTPETHQHLHAKVLLEVVEGVLRGGLHEVHAHARGEQCAKDLRLGCLQLLGGSISRTLLHDGIDRA